MSLALSVFFSFLYTIYLFPTVMFICMAFKIGDSSKLMQTVAMFIPFLPYVIMLGLGVWLL